jgi:succinate dehydrogenase / fumarate reductase cytochrome b subunit
MSEGERVVRGAMPAGQVIGQFVRSSVGAKVIMAATGIVLWGFLIGHLVGNLQIFQGPEAINSYGVFLRSVGHGVVVWVVRAFLAVCFLAHLATGLRLARLNRAARPIGYARVKRLHTSPAALWMAASGVLILVFLLFHVNQFATGWFDPAAFDFKDAEGRHDIHHMVFVAFKNPLFVVIYVVAQFVVVSHLMHGTASVWQSIGFHHPVWTPVLSLLGRSIAALIFIGNVAIPLIILIAWGNA